LFELAKVQEDNSEFDWAEATLIDVRRQQPENPEPYKRLAQFYARRATAMTRKAEPSRVDAVPGQPDDKGVYQVGGALTPPPRLDRPVYPTEALTAGVEGVVVVEVVINEQGDVADARVVRSIPMLDDAAIQAVRNWHFKPTTVQGNSVPVRMNVTVNFTKQ
jgi:TonB family protein